MQNDDMFIVTNEDELEQISDKILSATRVAFDTETDDLNITKLICAGFGLVTDKASVYFPLHHRNSKNIAEEIAFKFLNKVVNTVPEVWMHNAAFDYKVALKYGVRIPIWSVRDTMIASRLCNTSEHGLKPLAKELFDVDPPTYEEVIGRVKATLLPTTVVGPYCISDCYYTLKLAKYFVPKMKELGVYKAFVVTECPFSAVIGEMEFNGIKVDLSRIKEIEDGILPERDGYINKIREILGPIDVNSSQEVLKRAVQKGIWEHTKILKTDKGNDSSGATTIKWFAAHTEGVSQELAKLLLQYRELNTLLCTFTPSLQKYTILHDDNRIRTDIDATITFRLTSSKPNLQNMPARGIGKKLRNSFVADPGYKIVDIDYGQVEMRVAGILSGDKNICSVYRHGVDKNGNVVSDLHELMQKTLTEKFGRPAERKEAKTVNFGKLNRQGVDGFAVMYDLTQETSQMMDDAFYEAYSALKPFYRKAETFVMEHGYCQLMNGAKRWFSGNDGERVMMSNTPIQGNAAIFMKTAMINLLVTFGELGKIQSKEVKILHSIHDESMLEIKNNLVENYKGIVQSCFEYVTYQWNLSIPLLAEPGVGDSWLEAHA